MSLFEVLTAVFVVAAVGSSSLVALLEVNHALGAAEEQRRLLQCAESTAEQWLAGLPIAKVQVVDGLECHSEVVTQIVGGQAMDTVVAENTDTRVYLWLTQKEAQDSLP